MTDLDELLFVNSTTLFYEAKVIEKVGKVDCQNGEIQYVNHLNPPREYPWLEKWVKPPEDQNHILLRTCVKVSDKLRRQTLSEIQDVETGAIVWTSQDIVSPDALPSEHHDHRFISSSCFLFYDEDFSERLRLVDYRINGRDSVISTWETGPTGSVSCPVSL